MLLLAASASLCIVHRGGGREIPVMHPSVAPVMEFEIVGGAVDPLPLGTKEPSES